MKKLFLVPVLALALFVGHAVYPSSEELAVVGVEQAAADECDGVDPTVVNFVAPEIAAACGDTSGAWVVLIPCTWTGERYEELVWHPGYGYSFWRWC
jgi:hypothetical protein